MPATLFSSMRARRTFGGLGLLVTLLLSPAMPSAGIIFIPVGGFVGENDQGDRLVVNIRGEGPDLNGMTGQARFRDGATIQTTTVRIVDSTNAPNSSVLILKDSAGAEVVEIDLSAVSLTWLPTDTTFVSAVDRVNVRLTGRSRVDQSP